jgi:hypothetical protein
VYEAITESDYRDRALIEYEAARFHLAEAGHYEEAGYVENNIATILFKMGRTDAAREHLLSARDYLKDQPVQLAEVDITEAQVCLKEGKSIEAYSLMLDAHRTFIQCGKKRLLDASMDTMLKAAGDYNYTK